jgi:4,5:9,10-diseco-3-hydroxy-5,9,17-trioxoandrosta-1(10),2-diene-4-oate hydrolase
MKNFSDEYIVIDEYKTRYWIYGDAQETVLLLHGFALAIEVWELNIETIGKNYKVLALDLPGFGLTDKLKGSFHLDYYPQFLLKFLSALNILKVHIVGHSMGGLIATRFTQLFPAIVKSLVLVSSVGFKSHIPLHFRIFSLPLLGEIFVKPNQRGLQSALRKNTFYKIPYTKYLAEKLYEYSLHPEMPKTLLQVARSAIGVFGFKNVIIEAIKSDIDNLTMPVLIIWGENDAIIYVSHAFDAHKLVKNSKLVLFEKCGHLPQLEYPERFNAQIEDFLRHS